MRAAGIAGLGAYVPAQVLDNSGLESLVDTSDEWILRRTGIKERHIAAPDESTSTLAVRAAEAALSDAGVAADDIDAILLATTTPDRPIPPAACALQSALGAGGAAAFDVNAACSGFVTALIAAQGLIATGAARRVLVAGAEVLSRFVNPNDRSTLVLFGDGAGAAVIDARSEPGILASDWGADGTGVAALAVDAGGSMEPASHASVGAGRHFIRMHGPEVYRAAVRAMTESSRRALARAGMSVADLDLLVCHQANQRIVEETGRRLGVADDRVYSNVASYGNTSAASIPLALTDARAEGRLRPGDVVLATTVGAGFTWASVVLRWQEGGA